MLVSYVYNNINVSLLRTLIYLHIRISDRLDFCTLRVLCLVIDGTVSILVWSQLSISVDEYKWYKELYSRVKRKFPLSFVEFFYFDANAAETFGTKLEE